MASEDLTHLLSDLQGAETHLEQLKVLVRGWRKVRSLNGVERKRLALKLGWDSAEALVERLGEKEGLAPSELLRAVRLAEQKRPGDLAAILAGLRSPGERQEALRRALDLMGRVADRLDQSEEGVGEQTSEDSMPPPPPAAPTRGDPRPAMPARAAATGAAPAQVAPQAPDRPAAEPPRVTPSEAKPRPAATPPEVERPEAGRAPASKPVVISKSWEHVLNRPPLVSVPARPEPFGGPLPSDVLAPAATFDAEKSWTAKFRQLRESTHTLTPDALEATVQRFPDGWARRRAVGLLLGRGKGASFDTLARLLTLLSRPGDRYWCASLWLRDQDDPREQLPRLQDLLTPQHLARLQRRYRSLSRSRRQNNSLT